METAQHKKFSIEYNTRLQSFETGKNCYTTSLDGKIRTVKVQCPQCGCSDYVHNGYHTVENSIICNLGLNIRIAQFMCKKCGHYWSTERELVDALIQKEKELVKSLLIGCVRRGLAFESACALVEEKTGVKYSHQYLHELYTGALDGIKKEKFSTASGVYYYDEQYLKINGKEACRLTVKDAVTGLVLVDVQTADSQEGTIKRVLRQALQGLPAEVFIVDLLPRYPNIIKELYPSAKIQLCIFHLDQLIWKELHDEFGKNLPLQQKYNAYLLFNIFFEHTAELKKLDELLKKFNRYKFNDPKLDKQVEHCLLQEFSQFVRELKKERRRDNKRRPRRTLKQSKKIFTGIKQEISFFPKALQKRISFIEENWDKFTLFQRDSRVQPTTNGIEQYFGATLSKTDKKKFRSKAAAARELRAYQAEWNGHALFSSTKLIEVFSLVGLLFLAFPP